MKTLLVTLLLASVGCALTHEDTVIYDWEPEPSWTSEYSVHGLDRDAETAFGAVGGFALGYTDETEWGEARRVLKLKGGVRLEHGHSPRWWGEIGLRPHLYLGWDDQAGGDGTWAELTGYARVGVFFKVGPTEMGPWIGADMNFSNAARDTYGEHARKPGTGFMVGWSLRW